MNGATPLAGDAGRFGLLWDTLASREQAMLTSRVAGHTLEEIAQQHGLTRERIRQLILKAENQLTGTGNEAVPGWRQALHSLDSQPVVSASMIGRALGTGHPVIIEVFGRAAGFEPARAWGGVLRGWWTAQPDALNDLVRTIVSEAPMRSDELEGRVAAVCGDGTPSALLFKDPRSPLVQDSSGNWLRRRVFARDTAYLWLLERGEPCRTEELLRATSSSNIHSFREALRRDNRFRQIRPAGTWALAEWTHIDMPPWANAVEALVQAVTELGPISKESLFARVAERYPVSMWRLQQCLLHDEVGITPDGQIDLVSRGATPIEDPEPTKPPTMACDSKSNVIGVRLTVDKDLARGSGIVVNPWLTWKLGLRQAPMSKTFDVESGLAPLTVRRGTSAAQISTLRQHAEAGGMTIGCELIILLRIDGSTAKVLHACTPGACGNATPDRADITV